MLSLSIGVKEPQEPVFPVGLKVVGCCVDEEAGYIHPTLGYMPLLPRTPSMNFKKKHIAVVENEPCEDKSIAMI
jgi:hypothetical protein